MGSILRLNTAARRGDRQPTWQLIFSSIGATLNPLPTWHCERQVVWYSANGSIIGALGRASWFGIFESGYGPQESQSPGPKPPSIYPLALVYL